MSSQAGNISLQAFNMSSQARNMLHQSGNMSSQADNMSSQSRDMSSQAGNMSSQERNISSQAKNPKGHILKILCHNLYFWLKYSFEKFCEGCVGCEGEDFWVVRGRISLSWVKAGWVLRGRISGL